VDSILQFEAVFQDSLASCTKVRLEVFEQTGIQLRPEIDARFSQFAPHQGRKENTDA
jgi:UDP-N-acetylenolpyruvoylglucosamine reductase